jgi:hypothetical protein
LSPWRRRVPGLLASALLIGLLGLGALGSTVANDDSTASSQQETDTGRGLRPQSVGPFVNGITVDLAEAQSLVGFPVLRPNDILASDANLGTIWYEGLGPSSGHLALEYASGIEVTLQVLPVTDSAALFQQIAIENGQPDAIQSVQGVPALVFEQNSDVFKTNVGSVGFVIDGVYVVVYGHEGSSVLKRIAESVACGPLQPCSGEP